MGLVDWIFKQLAQTISNFVYIFLLIEVPLIQFAQLFSFLDNVFELAWFFEYKVEECFGLGWIFVLYGQGCPNHLVCFISGRFLHYNDL